MLDQPYIAGIAAKRDDIEPDYPVFGQLLVGWRRHPGVAQQGDVERLAAADH